MAAAPVIEEAFPLEGGWLCLGFCNTVGWHSGAYRRADLYAEGRPDESPETHSWTFSEQAPGSHERLTDYRALLRWFLRKRQLTVSDTKQLLRAARSNPDEGERVRQRAIALRETLYHLFAALAAERDPDPRDVAALNDWLPTALARRRLTYVAPRTTDSGSAEDSDDSGDPGHSNPPPFTWESSAPPDALDRLLWPVVWSAVDLLTSAQLSRIRECDNDPCGWLFVDMSRNRSRRWCDMRDCGNRVKARRHYQRVKAATP